MSELKKTNRFMARKLEMYDDPNSIVAEQYRTIRTNINFTLPSEEIKTILFTSASKEEGKSTTSANVAIAFAEAGKRVLLVDGDMRRPTLHHTFHIMSNTGLSNLLLKKGNLRDSIKKSGLKGLDLLPCGIVPANPAELLESEVMTSLLKEMVAEYDFVIFDSPPILAVTDAKILANKCDGSVLVVSTGKTEKANLIKARDALVTAKSFILGVVLNNYETEKKELYLQIYNN